MYTADKLHWNGNQICLKIQSVKLSAFDCKAIRAAYTTLAIFGPINLFHRRTAAEQMRHGSLLLCKLRHLLWGRLFGFGKQDQEKNIYINCRVMIWISTMQANVVVERDFVPVSVSTNKLSDKQREWQPQHRGVWCTLQSSKPVCSLFLCALMNVWTGWAKASGFVCVLSRPAESHFNGVVTEPLRGMSHPSHLAKCMKME